MASKRVFYDYIARGAPFGPDDGTLAPWAVVASLPFAPEIVLPTIQNYERMQLKEAGQYGYKATFNPTFPVEPKHEYGWVSPYHFGINQGPIVLMIENHRSGLLWSLMRQCPYLVTGLRGRDLPVERRLWKRLWDEVGRIRRNGDSRLVDYRCQRHRHIPGVAFPLT